MASADEREIRDAVVARLRELLPEARIVHELNVCGTGSNRIDVAAIGEDYIVGVEIKSRKDKLDRLGEQWRAFCACCHHVLVVAHEKHFVADPENNSFRRPELPPVLTLNHPLFINRYQSASERVWRYPRPEGKDELSRPQWTLGYGWTVQKSGIRMQPGATALLEMLWAAELREECARHRLNSHPRRNRYDMITEMAWLLTGREVCHAVCRQLRGRPFAEADAPDGEAAEALAPKQGELLA